ncbi:MAG TPA: hypothetical protein VJU84_16580 [Pyrinomonadaceae bacterium]|nr:hypothetical protein [Pyrinomonadaceae bacterium]
MAKIAICVLVIIVTGIVAFLVRRSNSQNAVQEVPVKERLILYRMGTTLSVDENLDSFDAIAEECQRLFEESDSSLKLIMSAERIERIKNGQTAIELILPRTRTVKLKNQQSVHYTKLLIPLEGEFANGTVFFAGAYDRTLHGKTPKYLSLMQYGSLNFVRNTGGLNKLKELLQRSGVEVK